MLKFFLGFLGNFQGGHRVGACERVEMRILSVQRGEKADLVISLHEKLLRSFLCVF